MPSARDTRNALQSTGAPGKLGDAMAEERDIRLGDKVIGTGMPGIFTVVGKRGPMLEIENARGLRRIVHEIALRRVDGEPVGSNGAEPES